MAGGTGDRRARRAIGGRGAWRGALALAAASTGDGCAPRPATQIVVRIFADGATVARLERLRLRAQREGERAFVDERLALSSTGCLTDVGAATPLRCGSFPGEVVLVPKDPEDATAVVVSVTGALGGDETLTQTARVHFASERTLYLAMTLTDACRARAPSCSTAQTCRDDACVPPDLALGEGPCTDLRSDPTNCGVCGRACPTTAHGTAVCGNATCGVCCDRGHAPEGGLCVPGCGSGQVRVAGACVLEPPRPVAPLSTAFVTSRRPTLRWALARGVDGARVEICSDRACATIEQTLEAAGERAVPTADLTSGVHYWRLFPRAGAAAGAVAGPVWEFVVGGRTAAHDASWGSVADFNGDGLADVVAGAWGANSYTGRVHIYYGNRGGVAPDPGVSFDGGDGLYTHFGSAVVNAGDVNGDGFADLAVVAGNIGLIRVYHGGAAGLATQPSVSLDDRGSAVVGAGDVNGDGFADLVVAGASSQDTWHAYIYYGSAAGVAARRSASVYSPDGVSDGYGFAFGSAGDVNGDGFADLAVGGVAAFGRSAHVYYGSAAGLPVRPSVSLNSSGVGDYFYGASIASAGDVNGDGFADLAVGAPDVSSGGHTHVYYGGEGGLSLRPDVSLDADERSTSVGSSMAGVGDLDGDGFDDLAIGSSTAMSARVYRGGEAGLAMSRSVPLASPDGERTGFGAALGRAGDVNGDGYDDLVVGAEGASGSTGRMYVYYGREGGLGARPDVVLVDSDGADSRFGSVIARACDGHGGRGEGSVGGPRLTSRRRARRLRAARAE